nr:reverse transcriptase domain-containing protein [Tanacetum cinerariifolium]
MANLPPRDHAADLPDDGPVNIEPAPMIQHHAPAPPEGYIDDDDIKDDEEDPDEDPEEELIEQVFPEQNNMDGFDLHMNPQSTGNMNGWLIKDDDEEVEKDGHPLLLLHLYFHLLLLPHLLFEDEAEVINAYEEVDSLNRPPPTSDEDTEFTPPVVLIADINDEPKPHVIQFGRNFHVKEGSSAGALLAEIQRLENELRILKLRDTNIAAYTQRFNELALLCPEAVLSEKKKVELYINGWSKNIKGETTSSRPAILNDAVRMAHTLMEQKIQDKAERIAESNKMKWKSNTIKLVVAIAIATTTTEITTEATTVITTVTTNIIIEGKAVQGL